MKLEIVLEHEPFLVKENTTATDLPQWLFDNGFDLVKTTKHHIIVEDRYSKTITVGLSGDYLVMLFGTLISVSKKELNKCISQSAD